MARRRGEVTYEVHVLQGGRWQMQARYQEWQMDPAIDDARNLDRLPGIECVKVVKEEYDDDEGLSKETIIYQSGAGRSGRSGGGGSSAASSSSSSDWDDFDDESGGGRSRRRSGGKRGADGFGDDPDDFDDFDDIDGGLKRKKKQKSGNGGTAVQVLVKILLITLLSVAIAAALTGIAFTMLGGVGIKASVKTNLLSALFVGSFLLSLGSIGIPYMRKISFGGSKRPKPPAKTNKPARRSAGPAKPARTAKKKQSDDDIDALFAKAEANLKDDADDEPFEAPQDVPEAPEESVEQPGGLSAAAEKQRQFALQFLNSSLSQLSDEHKKMESFHKFGVNLFMAGACENLGEKRGLEPAEVEAILSECVQVMGFKESDATGFAGKYEEYLLNDARYMQMFQSGRNAMNTFRGDEEAGLKHLNQAMREWNKPKTREEVQGPVTVLFTDIAGSTAMTQQLGDAGAQQVVRAHNRVVREALTQYGGREIKHTGDGIMASFSTTSNGVEAAIMMQRGVVAHNTANPNLPLHLKIGINAGEPISEDNDLFGTTVQMAARIVDKAQADQIFVSEIVRGICAGKPIRFTNRGAYDMKGFDDGVVLYEALWQEPQQAAEAPAAAAQS
ncbi:MAG: adenylate/guanylate cyclase domain-containing protein [Rhodospirillales bacterium]